MTTATQRAYSSLAQFVKRVPPDALKSALGRPYPITLPAVGGQPEALVEVIIRPFIKFSLRVRDPDAIKVRVSAAETQIGQIFAGLRLGAVELTRKQTVALSGEIYRLVVDRFETDPGDPEFWEAWKGFHWAAMDGRIPDPPQISWKELMDERRAATNHFGVSSGPLPLDVIEHLPPGDSDRSSEVDD